MSDFSINEWLTTIGMAKYIELFERNLIDFDVLFTLSEQGLKDLGIALGDRKRLQ